SAFGQQIRLSGAARRRVIDAHQAASTTSTPVCSTPTVTRSPVPNPRAAELVLWAPMTVPSASVQCTRETGPRNATDVTDAVPAGSAVTVTDSGRTIARPAPESMEPGSAS